MLTIKRPTPTTVLYTVSTRSVNRTLGDQVQRLAIASVRILIGLFTFAILLQKADISFPIHVKNIFFFLPPFPQHLTQGNPAGRLAYLIASTTPWKWLLLPSLAILWFVFRRGYTEESLLVIRGLGVQTSTSSPTYLSTSSARFIPTSMIQDIFIYEAFKGFEVRFYLAIVIEGEEDVVVVFPVCFDHVLEWFGGCANRGGLESIAQTTDLGGGLARSESLSL